MATDMAPSARNRNIVEIENKSVTGWLFSGGTIDSVNKCL